LKIEQAEKNLKNESENNESIYFIGTTLFQFRDHFTLTQTS